MVANFFHYQWKIKNIKQRVLQQAAFIIGGVIIQILRVLPHPIILLITKSGTRLTTYATDYIKIYYIN